MNLKQNTSRGGGKIIKTITRKRTQDSLTWLKERNTTNVIWEEKIAKSTKYSRTLIELKKMWKAIGCTDYYFFEHALHSLRHVGIHYWLDASDYDFFYVADLVGSKNAHELKESYGDIPPEVKARKMKKFRGKISKVGLNI